MLHNLFHTTKNPHKKPPQIKIDIWIGKRLINLKHIPFWAFVVDCGGVVGDAQAGIPIHATPNRVILKLWRGTGACYG